MKLRGDRNRCTGCGLYFNSTAAFDKHRVGPYSKDRRCLTTTEMLEKGMAQNTQGFWVGSRRPFTLQLANEGYLPVTA